MKESYTNNALIQFLYHELPVEETINVIDALEHDAVFRADYDELHLAKNQLPKVQFNPSSAVLNNILLYSAQTALEAQH